MKKEIKEMQIELQSELNDLSEIYIAIIDRYQNLVAGTTKDDTKSIEEAEDDVRSKLSSVISIISLIAIDNYNKLYDTNVSYNNKEFNLNDDYMLNKLKHLCTETAKICFNLTNSIKIYLVRGAFNTNEKFTNAMYALVPVIKSYKENGKRAMPVSEQSNEEIRFIKLLQEINEAEELEQFLGLNIFSFDINIASEVLHDIDYNSEVMYRLASCINVRSVIRMINTQISELINIPLLLRLTKIAGNENIGYEIEQDDISFHIYKTRSLIMDSTYLLSGLRNIVNEFKELSKDAETVKSYKAREIVGVKGLTEILRLVGAEIKDEAMNLTIGEVISIIEKFIGVVGTYIAKKKNN